MKRANFDEVVNLLTDPEWQDAFRMWNSTRRSDNTSHFISGGCYVLSWKPKKESK